MAAIETKMNAHKFTSRKPSHTFYNNGANSMANYNVIGTTNSLGGVGAVTKTPKP